MQIVLSGTGKKFNNEWIFRDLDFTFSINNPVAILGRNGSGKSTLLQVISGSLHPTAGSVKYFRENEEIPADRIFRHLSIVAPYQELIEEFTLQEMLRFHFSFKSMLKGFTLQSITDRIGFKDPGHKPIRVYSSGMKQRIKLVLALLSDVSIVLLDEPTMNLDETGSRWYIDLVNELATGRIFIVCSNLQKQETSFCKEHLFIEDFKKT